MLAMPFLLLTAMVTILVIARRPPLPTDTSIEFKTL